MTNIHSKYYAYYLTLQNPSLGPERLGNSLLNATIDMNPHQVQGALFYFRNPLSTGVILADEVGLGKTIEAGLIICQLWSELKRKILLIVPASLRKQWQSELSEKFFLPSEVLDGKTRKEFRKKGIKNPFEQNKIIITSYQFASKHEAEIVRIKWNIAIVDEAHNLRNVYRNPTGTASAIQRMLQSTKKLLLTATPLQNSLMELFGLVSFIDPYAFGDRDSFKKQFSQPNHLQLKDLRERMRPILNRTLRKDVMEYIRYTKRIPMTQNFEPTDDEVMLYEKISEFLQREELEVVSVKTRHLIILILRKLLASSSHAIAGTLDGMIERIEHAKSLEEVIDDEDMLEEYEELIDDDDEQEELVKNLKQLRSELDELKAFRDLANSIKVDTKTKALGTALETAFTKLDEQGSPKKALIFTGFRRTQEYLKSYLEAHGYDGKIVLFNGSNSDPQSRWIYQNRLRKYEGSDKISGSKSSDMRASLVEYFRDEAEIMIATESASEGVNLQFCSLLINYDLPWNPQRIEQRIGRCHRYGQKHDVIVMNFLNTRNRADQRTYQLLDQKFELFAGVFGASDQILGVLDDGKDFEQRILNIYQTCRSKEQIDEAFDALQNDLEQSINSRMNQAREEVLEHFDAEVVRRLKNIEQEGLQKLGLFKEIFRNLSKNILGDKAIFDDENISFVLHNPPSIDIQIGQYSMLKEDLDHAFFHRTQSSLGEYIINEGKMSQVQTQEIIFNPNRYHSKISALEQMIGQSGRLRVDKLTITSFDNEEYLIGSIIDDSGSILDPEIVHKLFLIPGESNNKEVKIPQIVSARLEDVYILEYEKVFQEAIDRNSAVLNEQINKLDSWEEDKKLALLKELDEIKTEIAIKRRESIKSTNAEEKLSLRKEVTKLEQLQKKKQEEYFIHVDEIQTEKWKLIDELEERMRAGKEVTHLYTIRRSVK